MRELYDYILIYRSLQQCIFIFPTRYQQSPSRPDVTIYHCWIHTKSELCQVLLFIFFFIFCVFLFFLFLFLFFTLMHAKNTVPISSLKIMGLKPCVQVPQSLSPQPSHIPISTQKKIKNQNRKQKAENKSCLKIQQNNVIT